VEDSIKEENHSRCPKPYISEGHIWDTSSLRKIQEHPCYSPKAVHAYGRIHLSVAPKCNIECNYCLRDFDCIHETRPGVTSRLISPGEAVERVSEVIANFPYIKVVGIAGPGEPLANEETFETFRLIKNAHPQLHLCMSSNCQALKRQWEMG
jgi:nitrogen fixation protein NifB